MALYAVTNGMNDNALDVDQYRQLLTGTMTDQPVTVSNRVRAQLTGATAASGYVGGTTTGAPVSGTFAVGDVAVAQNGPLYVCTSGGTPGVWQATPSQIGTQTLGSPAASVTFSAIPAHTSLRLHWHARCDGSGSTQLLLMRVNGDTGSTYHRQYTEAIGGGGSGSSGSTGQSSLLGGQVAATSATANYFAGGSMTWTGWAGAAGWPTVVSTCSAFVTGATTSTVGTYCGQYTVAGPYTSITLYPASGNFVAGSTFSLYAHP